MRTEERIIVSKEILSKQQMGIASQILSAHFINDPLLKFILKNEKKVENFIQAVLPFFNSFGDIIVARINNEMVGISLWTPPNAKSIKIKALTKPSTLGALFKFIKHTPISKYPDLIKFGRLLNENHHQMEEFYYLFMIATEQNEQAKETRSLMIEYAQESFNKALLTDERNLDECNTMFYKKMGFTPIKKFSYKDINFETFFW